MADTQDLGSCALYRAQRFKSSQRHKNIWINITKKKLYIPEVDKNDFFIKKIDRWEAHQNAILHRGFTTILKYQDKLILQLRKHIVFDGYWDLSFSSHPLIIKDKIQSFDEAIKFTYQREWITNDNIKEIKFIDKYYYKEFDKKSGFYEHEINYLYLMKINSLPKNNPEFSYDMKIIKDNDLEKQLNQLKFAPWVTKINFKKLTSIL